MLDNTQVSTFPALADATRIETYGDAEKILISPEFATELAEDVSAPLRKNTLPNIDGSPHEVRRRLMLPLFSTPAIVRFHQDITGPSIDMCLSECREARHPDGLVRADLVRLVRLMGLRTSAAMVGVDAIDTPDRASALLDYVIRTQDGRNLRWSTRPAHELLRDALEAEAAFVAEFLEPAIARRRGLIKQHLAGEIGQVELPSDLIMIMLNNPQVWDDTLIIKDAMVLLVGGISTTSQAVTYAVEELKEWLPAHPEDNQAVAAGQVVLLVIDRINRDPLVFGDDADEFNPNRTLPPRYPGYGLSFGAGRHACIGRPVVTTAAATTADEVERSVVPILRSLIDAGVTMDPQHQPTMFPSSTQLFGTYPVILARL